MRKILIMINLAFIALSLPNSGFCSSITYYDLNFEDGSLGGGVVSGPWSLPTNVLPSDLDGRALEFSTDAEIRWDRNDINHNFHSVSFDYFTTAGGNVSLILDMPQILRIDFDEVGRHHAEVHFDFTNREVFPYLDNILDTNLITHLAWTSATPIASDIRIANQFSEPGNSTASFQIDNLLWTGTQIPEPTTAMLFGIGLLGLAGVSRRKQ